MAIAYDIFLSYNRGTAMPIARELQRGLHAFGKPLFKMRARRVFLDQTDLSAGPAFRDYVLNAAVASQSFLLLASPASAKSTWVDAEIVRRLETRGTDRFIIVLISGSIVWDQAKQDFDWGKTTALSRVLSGAFSSEPLYLDLTWIQDNSDLTLENPRFVDAVAQIVATLTGRLKAELISDDLIQRRKTLRLAYVVVATLAILSLATSVAAFVAFRESRISLSRQLAAYSESLTSSQYDLSLLLALEALRFGNTIEARRSLQDAVQFSPQLDRFLANVGSDMIGDQIDVTVDGRGERYEIAAPSESYLFDRRGGLLAAFKKQVKYRYSADGTETAQADDSGISLLGASGRQPNLVPIAQLGFFGFVGRHTLAVVKPGGSLTFYSTNGARNLLLPGVHEREIFAASADERFVAGIWPSSESYVRIWRVSGNGVAPYADVATAHGDVATLEFSPDSKSLFLGGYDGDLSWIHLAQNLHRAVAAEALFGHASTLMQIAFARSALITSAQDRTILVWHRPYERPDGTPLLGHGEAVSSLSASAHSDRIISGDISGTAISWVLGRRSRILRGTMYWPSSRGISTVNPCGDKGEFLVGNYHGGLVLLDGQHILGTLLPNRSSTIFAGYCAKNDQIVVSIDYHGMLNIWDKPAKAHSRFNTGESPPQFLALSAEANRIAISSDADSTRIAEVNYTKRIHVRREHEFDGGGPIAFSSDGETFALADDASSSLDFYRVASHTRLWHQQFADGSDPTSLAFRPDGRQIAVGFNSSMIGLVDVRSGKTVMLRSPQQGVHIIAYSPDGHTLASGGENGSVVLWDVGAQAVLGEPLKAYNGGILALSFSTDGKTVVAGDSTGRVMFWDVDPKDWTRIACYVANRHLTQAEFDSYVGETLLRKVGLDANVDLCSIGRVP